MRNIDRAKKVISGKMHTSRICMEPISPSASSNSTRSDSQNGVEPSL